MKFSRLECVWLGLMDRRNITVLIGKQKTDEITCTVYTVSHNKHCVRYNVQYSLLNSAHSRATHFTKTAHPITVPKTETGKTYLLIVYKLMLNRTFRGDAVKGTAWLNVRQSAWNLLIIWRWSCSNISLRECFEFFFFFRQIAYIHELFQSSCFTLPSRHRNWDPWNLLWDTNAR